MTHITEIHRVHRKCNCLSPEKGSTRWNMLRHRKWKLCYRPYIRKSNTYNGHVLSSSTRNPYF